MCDMMKRCQDMEVYVVHDVIINIGEKDEDHFDYFKDAAEDDFVNRDGKLNILDKKREMMRKANLNHVAINFVVLIYCSRLPPTRSSPG